MNRRDALFAGAVLALLPLRAQPQQPGKTWRVGYLESAIRPSPLDESKQAAFPRRLGELGYVEGKNLVIEWRFAGNRPELIAELAMELVRLKVDVIVTTSTPVTLAAQKATATIPIVMTAVADPVGVGLLNSLARPGGNVTGVTIAASEIALKRMEMLLGVMGKRTRVAYLLNPNNPQLPRSLESVRTVWEKRGVTILRLDARTPQEIDQAFVSMVKQNVQGLLVAQDPFLTEQAVQIAGLAVKRRLPSMGALGEYVQAGGLMSYGESRTDSFNRAAIFVHKILQGAAPADLPVEQPTKFEMAVNTKTARALGLTLPKSLLLLADKVIE